MKEYITKKIQSPLHFFERKSLTDHGCKKILMLLLKKYLISEKKSVASSEDSMQNAKKLKLHTFGVKHYSFFHVLCKVFL